MPMARRPDAVPGADGLVIFVSAVGVLVGAVIVPGT
jgi:hypothetical protein